ncbi:MAG: putative amidophosphoribosyltransferase, partial [Alphaproteobacteria bacterium]
MFAILYIMLIENEQSTTYFSKIKALMSMVGSIFMPASCIFCRQILSTEKNMGVCPACFGALPVWDKADVAMPKIPVNVDSFDAPFLYEAPVKGAITQMKFADKPEYAGALARLMADMVRGVGKDTVLMIPVPMHKKRLFKRQYNQATLLAQGIQRTIGIDLDIFSLKRTRKTA